jgi:hypothetical protein
MSEKEVKEIVYLLENIFEVSMWERVISFEKVADKDDEDNLADIRVWHDYRKYSLRIYPKFFTETRYSQVKTLIHEFCHIPTSLICDQSDKLLDGKLVTKDEVRIASESVTSWFEQIIYKALLTLKK